MWIVSMDETEQFEKEELDRRSFVNMLVGGTVYKCEDGDVDAEIDRLTRFFRMICEENGCSYPEDLHLDQQKNPVHKQRVNKVKEELEKAMPDFLQGKGRWEQDKPRGAYELYAIVGDKSGMGNESQVRTGNLFSDAYASNRYEHMAYRVLQNLLFYNLKCEEDNIRLDLAARKFPVYSDKAAADAADLGAQLKVKKPDKSLYQATTAYSYRAMLLEAVADNAKTKMHFDINVDSINYGEEKRNQVFLYLADTVCSIYFHLIHDAIDSGDALQKLVSCANRIVGGKNGNFWAYHPVDAEYRAACRAFQLNDDFAALLRLNRIRERRDGYAQVYDRLWLRDLEAYIAENHRADLPSVERLNAYLDSQEYRLDTASAILRVLETQCAREEQTERNARLLFELRHAKITMYNHSGNYAEAIRVYDDVMRMADYIPVEEYLELRNVLSVSLLDSLRPEEALRMTLQTLEYADMLTEIKKDIYTDARDRHLLRGRTLSQLGQCYAFMGRHEEAARSFEKAIEVFGDNAGDVGKTRSFYLHELIEAGDRAEYEAQAALYFRSLDPEEQLKDLTDNANKLDKFVSYVYIKALWFLYRDKLTKAFVDRLTRKIYEDYGANGDGHPWELILKYCALLRLHVLKAGKDPFTLTLMDKAAEAVKDDTAGILPVIVKESRDTFERARKNEADIFRGTTLTYMYR